jgi:hypothetical protein
MLTTGYDRRRRVRQTVGSRGPRAYAAAMAGHWLDLRSTLTRLDALAAEPDAVDHDELPSLQYELHNAGEVLAGLEPPEGAEILHDELADALSDARDATAEVWEAFALGGYEAATALVWEWRGALFRVRYARMQLEPLRDARPAPVPPASPPPARTPPAATAGVVAMGSALVLAAALLGLWLLVGLTLAATLAASVLLRP